MKRQAQSAPPPIPADLERMAASTQSMPSGPWHGRPGIAQYMPAICTLRHEKGFTWRAIKKWLEERCATYSMQHIYNSHRLTCSKR